MSCLGYVQPMNVGVLDEEQALQESMQCGAGCGNRGDKICQCRAQRYCSKKCQRANWRAHKPTCRQHRQVNIGSRTGSSELVDVYPIGTRVKVVWEGRDTYTRIAKFSVGMCVFADPLVLWDPVLHREYSGPAYPSWGCFCRYTFKSNGVLCFADCDKMHKDFELLKRPPTHPYHACYARYAHHTL
jgi:hypothetical protein